MKTPPGIKIWFADDDPEDRMILRTAFEAIGKPAVLEAFNGGIELLEQLKAAPSPSLPALVILDQNMPRFSGTQTLQALKSDPLFSGIPVVVYSTSMNVFEREACLNAGAVDYVVKPFYFDESKSVAEKFYKMAAQPADNA